MRKKRRFLSLSLFFNASRSHTLLPHHHLPQQSAAASGTPAASPGSTCTPPGPRCSFRPSCTRRRTWRAERRARRRLPRPAPRPASPPGARGSASRAPRRRRGGPCWNRRPVVVVFGGGGGKWGKKGERESFCFDERGEKPRKEKEKQTLFSLSLFSLTRAIPCASMEPRPPPRPPWRCCWGAGGGGAGRAAGGGGEARRGGGERERPPVFFVFVFSLFEVEFSMESFFFVCLLDPSASSFLPRRKNSAPALTSTGTTHACCRLRSEKSKGRRSKRLQKERKRKSVCSSVFVLLSLDCGRPRRIFHSSSSFSL